MDFLVEGRVIVELDGGEFRSSKAQFQRDRERTNAAQIAGFTCLRFTRADILHCPDEFARTVAEAVKRAPGPPRPR